MKFIKIILCLLAISAISCSDSETATIQNEAAHRQNVNDIKYMGGGYAPIKGTWNWIQTNGGFAGVTETPASTGITKKMVFVGNTYRIYINGIIARQGIYTITYEHCIHNGMLRPVIYFSNDFLGLMIESVSAHTLGLSEDSPDGFGHTYVRN